MTDDSPDEYPSEDELTDDPLTADDIDPFDVSLSGQGEQHVQERIDTAVEAALRCDFAPAREVKTALGDDDD